MSLSRSLTAREASRAKESDPLIEVGGGRRSPRSLAELASFQDVVDVEALGNDISSHFSQTTESGSDVRRHYRVLVFLGGSGGHDVGTLVVGSHGTSTVVSYP